MRKMVNKAVVLSSVTLSESSRSAKKHLDFLVPKKLIKIILKVYTEY